MVAYMTYTKSYARALHYNEKKVEQGNAAFIHAENFLIDKERLTTKDKAAMLKRISESNPGLKNNTLHAKLLFHPDERLPESTLSGIADRYMALIGFRDQPYLVYRHDDAGEQHLHIVSSLITDSGKRIEPERQPWGMSVEAAQVIEREYGLKPVAKKLEIEPVALKPAFVRRIEYGKKNIIRSVGEVIQMISKEYKFTSLDEFNALLRPYNIYADRCRPGSHTYQQRGLYYRVLNENGKNRCTPIKSSDLRSKPGLKKLEQLFRENQLAVKETIPFTRSRIDWILLQEPETLQELDQALKTEGITLVIGKGEATHPETFFADHQSRAVVNGRSLGKEYGSEELFRQFPDSLQKHHTAVPQLLSHLTQQLPVSGDAHYHQQDIRIRKQL